MNWDEVMEEEAAKRRAESIALDNDPAYQSRIKKKKEEEHKRGVRLGWWTEDGEPIPQPEDEEEEE